MEVKLLGRTPLLMHNGQLADPLNQYTKALKEVSSKRKKSDEDHEELARIEVLGGLYLDEDNEPCIPGELLEACIVEGAKKFKKGKVAKGCVICDGNFKLWYEGPRDPESIAEDPSMILRIGVRVMSARVMRSRARFKQWETTATIQYDSSICNDRDIVQWLEAAGDVGIGDFRPKYGRFRHEVISQ